MAKTKIAYGITGEKVVKGKFKNYSGDTVTIKDKNGRYHQFHVGHVFYDRIAAYRAQRAISAASQQHMFRHSQNNRFGVLN